MNNYAKEEYDHVLSQYGDKVADQYLDMSKALTQMVCHLFVDYGEKRIHCCNDTRLLGVMFKDNLLARLEEIGFRFHCVKHVVDCFNAFIERDSHDTDELMWVDEDNVYVIYQTVAFAVVG
jgi:hypothetical protein